VGLVPLWFLLLLLWYVLKTTEAAALALFWDYDLILHASKWEKMD